MANYNDESLEGRETNGTSTQESSTQRTQKDRKQEAPCSASKQEALDLLNKWKVGMLATCEFNKRTVVVFINEVFNKHSHFPLCKVTVMDPKFGDVNLPLFDLRPYNG